jgi:hypothetical protein
MPYVVEAVLHPSDKEEAIVRLPTLLRGLYYLIRPLRLIWKYTVAIRTGRSKNDLHDKETDR